MTKAISNTACQLLNRPAFMNWIIAGIFFISLIIRLNQVPDLAYFMLDEERDAFLVRRMLVDHRPLLIGGSIPGGINVGPAFFYISAIPYYLSRLNPLGPAWAAGIIGIIGVIGVFWVGKEIFNRRVGLVAMAFAGFSVLNIIYHRPWWPLTMSQVVTLAVYLCLSRLSVFGYQLSDKGQSVVSLSGTNNRYLLILVIALIIGAQSDPSTLSLIPLSIIWLWWHRKHSGLIRKHYLAAVGLFILAHATWIVFEFRHDFLNTRAAIELFKGLTFASTKVRPYELMGGFFSVLQMTAATIYRLFFITGPLDVTKQISPADEFLRLRLEGVWWSGAYILLLVIGYYVISSFKGVSLPYGKETPYQRSRRLLSLHFLISISGILVYTSVFPGYVHEWMWAFMFPGFFLMAGILLVKLAEFAELAKLAVIVVVLGWTVWQVSLFTKLDNVAGLGKKLAVVKAAQTEISERQYELRSEGEEALRYGGWRYLFTLYGNPPVKSYMDYVYQDWVYPKVEVAPVAVVVVNNLRDNTATFTISELEEGVDKRGDD